MKQMIFSNWNFMRALRLIMGIAIAVQAVMARDALFGLAGLLLTGMAVFNIGCCGTGGCSTPVKKNTESTKDITYEEVV
jgi:hypothetical protein